MLNAQTKKWKLEETLSRKKDKESHGIISFHLGEFIISLIAKRTLGICHKYILLCNAGFYYNLTFINRRKGVFNTIFFTELLTELFFFAQFF